MVEIYCDLCEKHLSTGDFLICAQCEKKYIQQIQELQKLHDRIDGLLEEIRRLKGEGFSSTKEIADFLTRPGSVKPRDFEEAPSYG